MLGGTFGMRRPVGRQHEDIGAQKGQYAGRFGEGPVVADVHADSQSFELMHRKREVTGVDEHVDAQKRQVDLAIDSLNSIWADQDTGVEEP